MATVAGTLINRVRAKIPDWVFVNDVPQPTVDGKFRVQILYGWLDDALQVLTQLTGWTLTDWWALPQVALQPWYLAPQTFVSLEAAYSNKWELDVVSLDETDTIWPTAPSPLSTQPLAAYVRSIGTVLSVGVWPTPITTDPTTTLTGAITASTPDPILVVSTTGFLSFGYVLIDAEVIQYQTSTATGLGTISRGIGGTTAVSHLINAPVRSLGLWIKGKRVPTPIVDSLSPVEVPLGWMSHLETYVLAQCRMEQKRFQEGQALLQAFEAACKGVNADPNWKVNRGQIRAFGDWATVSNSLGGFGVIIP